MTKENDVLSIKKPIYLTYPFFLNLAEELKHWRPLVILGIRRIDDISGAVLNLYSHLDIMYSLIFNIRYFYKFKDLQTWC